MVPSAVVKMRLLTAQRGTEIRAMKHDDIHGDVWVQPAETTKKGKRHVVPLSPQARTVVASLEPFNRDREHVFPSDRTGGPISRLESLLVRLRDALPFSDFQFRDLRRTVTTRMAEDLKIPRLHIAKILGHEVPGITGVYDQASYMDEKRDALHRWGEELEGFMDKIVAH